MKTFHYISCKAVYFNPYTKKEEDLIGEIRKDKWLKFKKLIEKKYIKKLDEKTNPSII